MSAVFADTFYWLGLNNRGDPAHDKCRQFTQQHRDSLITTTAVLLEYANSASRPPFRTRAAAFLATIEANPRVRVVPLTPDSLNAVESFTSDTRTRTGR